MPALIQRILSPQPGTAPPLAGLFLWQLDDPSLAGLTDADLDRRFRTPANREGDDREFEGTIGRALYHALEHEAGRYGQINLLRCRYRAREAAGS